MNRKYQLKVKIPKVAISILSCVLGRSKVLVSDVKHIKPNTVIINARNEGVYRVVNVDGNILKLETISNYIKEKGKLKFYCRDIFIVPLEEKRMTKTMKSKCGGKGKPKPRP